MCEGDWRTRSLVLLIAALIAPGISGACRQLSPPPPRPIRVLLGSSPDRTVFAGLETHLRSAFPSFRVSVTGTLGSPVVVSRLDSRQGDIGVAQADVTYAALRHGTETEPRAHHNLRALAVLESSKLYIVGRSGRGLSTVGDLRGKRVLVARRGGASELFTRVVLGAYGLTYHDMATSFVPFESIVQEFVDGDGDAMIATFGEPPVSRLAAADSSPDLFEFLPIDGAAVRTLRSEYPFIRPVVVEGRDSLPGHDPLHTVGVDSLLICRGDLDHDLAYEFTRAFFEWRDTVLGRPLDRDSAAAAPIPLHPGAARYYREREILR